MSIAYILLYLKHFEGPYGAANHNIVNYYCGIVELVRSDFSVQGRLFFYNFIIISYLK